MPDAVLVTSADGIIKYINRAGEELFGYERMEVIGQPLEMLVPARFRDAHRLERKKYLDAPRVRPMGLGLDLRGLTKGGQEFAVEISLSPMQVGTETYTVAVVRDVTDRKRLEQRAREAEKAEQEVRQRDEVLAVASHELRGPVGTVQLQVTVLQKAAAEAIRDLNAMRDRMQKIERNARHLARLVDELLDTTQVQDRGPPIKLEDMDLAELTRDAVERMRDEVEGSGARLTLNAAAPVRGRWDPVRMEQVVTNLVANASKFGRGKPIAVTVDADADRARISVADEGIGIEAADQERIFERFEQVSPSAARDSGLGLGLYVVRRIVQAHGGRVLVRSALGAGSTFTVELPLFTDRVP